ncbi:TPA: DUF1566 domain-containing protein [Vibrio cholerae]|nr:DUF1566 domain-containing protein [Vibrio cholerae]EJL6549178.1 DUF1566 domain-containing protein [Vibrio cholerae]
MMKKLFLPLAALTITACQPEPNVALRIDCGEFNDQGVAITLNGTPIGDCPLDIMTHAGQTDISVNKTFADASYLEGTQSVMLAENVNKRVKFELQQIYGENYYYKKITTIADAREYLKRFPQGKYAQQVSEKLEDWFYEKTTDLSGMNEYLKLYPEGRYAREINKKRELFYVEKATSVETAKQYFKHYPQGEYYQKLEESFYQKTSSLQGMNDYLELYPKGKNAIEVGKKLEAYYFERTTSIDASKEYLKRYPQGQYTQKVHEKLEGFFYENTTSLAGINEYLKLYPSGKHVVEIRNKHEDFYFKKANSAESMNEYLKLYPKGKYTIDISQRLEDLYFQKATNLTGMNEYLKFYPNGKHTVEVKQKLEYFYYEKASNLDGVNDYLRLYPQGRYNSAVLVKKEQLRVIDERYYDNEDGTITDKKTGLVWMRCSFGQSWNGKTCVGKAKGFLWQHATELKHNFAGSTAWRLPTIDELDSLVYCSTGRTPSVRPNGKYIEATSGMCFGGNKSPSINVNAFPSASSHSYWSSSPDANGRSNAWGVYFYSGHVSIYMKSVNYHYVRLVRAGQ